MPCDTHERLGSAQWAHSGQILCIERTSQAGATLCGTLSHRARSTAVRTCAVAVLACLCLPPCTQHLYARKSPARTKSQCSHAGVTSEGHAAGCAPPVSQPRPCSSSLYPYPSSATSSSQRALQRRRCKWARDLWVSERTSGRLLCRSEGRGGPSIIPASHELPDEHRGGGRVPSGEQGTKLSEPYLAHVTSARSYRPWAFRTLQLRAHTTPGPGRSPGQRNPASHANQPGAGARARRRAPSHLLGASLTVPTCPHCCARSATCHSFQQTTQRTRSTPCLQST